MKNKKSKRSRFKSFVQSSNFLFIVSVFVSLIIWVYMSSVSTGNDTSLLISSIPVKIELSDETTNNGLRVFSDSDYTASVTVKGQRSVVGSLQPSDITVKASDNNIDSTGNYTLYLSASKNNPYSDYQISSINPTTIDVFIDYYRENTYDIQDNVVYKVEDGYYAATTLSSKEVTISGPQTVVSKIAKVVATATIDGTLKSSTKVNADIILYDANGNEISKDLLSVGLKTVEASVSVLPEKEVSLKPTFTNMPSGLQLTDDMLSVEPKSILIAGTQEVFNKTDYINLAPIDFNTLTNTKTTFDLAVEIPTDCKNISNTSTAKVTLDLSSLSSKKLTVEKFSVQGLASGYSADVTQKSLEVVAYGTSSQIDSLIASDVTAIIDLSASDGMKGSVSMPVTFAINNAPSCWISGSYKANLTISESS